MLSAYDVGWKDRNMHYLLISEKLVFKKGLFLGSRFDFAVDNCHLKIV